MSKKEKNSKRTIGLFFKVSEEEKAMIQKKMELLHTHNQRTYLRKMAIDGFIVNLELDCIKEMVFYFKKVSNSFNQIARCVNATGNFYSEDLEEMKKENQKIWTAVNEILGKIENL